MQDQLVALEMLENWMSLHLPELLEDLNSGATNEEILELEELIGVTMPDSFKSLYGKFNGQKGDIFTGFFYGMTFLPINNICTQWKSWDGYYQDEKLLDKDSLHCKSVPENRIKRKIANSKWIPIAYDHGGNYFGLDLDPDENGCFGQVINFGKDETTKYVLGGDLNEFLSWYASQLENDNFGIIVHEGEGSEFNTLRPPTSHFLDSCKEIFKT